MVEGLGIKVLSIEGLDFKDRETERLVLKGLLFERPKLEEA